MELAAGSKVPAFKLFRDGGGVISLTDFKHRKLVIYFYPKADTPGCTREAIDFSKLRADTRRPGRTFWGFPPIRSRHRTSSGKSTISGLRSPPTRPTRCSRPMASGAKSPCTAGLSWGITRTTFLIGADGRIARIWPKVKVDGHAAEVLAAARALAG
jgi:peroxiredoxin Q/BCP